MTAQILRALGELVLHRPSSGSFVSYAREFYGEKMAYAAGWLYFLNWATTSIVPRRRQPEQREQAVSCWLPAGS